jgi:molecular chaperone DnaK (HSP70)
MSKQVIGIDLGMSNTSVCCIDTHGQIKLIPDELGNTIIPTCVMCPKTKKIHRYFKRTLGENELSKELTILFLKKIKKLAEDYLNTLINSCVISIPVESSFKYKNTLSDCCKEVGLELLALIPEPVAAVLSEYNSTSSSFNSFLTIDCGGGTVDLSLVSVDTESNCFEVVDSLGDFNLGGEDLTQNLMKYIKNKYATPELLSLSDDKLFNYSKKTKETLSYKLECNLYIEEIDKQIRISRNEFNFINKIWFDKFKDLLLQFKEQIKNEEIDINCIVLIGGTTKVNYIQEIVNVVFNEKEIKRIFSKDNLVALGCGYKAKIEISSNSFDEQPILLQKLNNSIGIEVENGEMAVVLSQNSLIPISKTVFFTNTNEEDNIQVKIYSGERKYVKDNTFIGKINIHFLEKKKRGEHKIEITLGVNESSLIEIHIKTSENLNYQSLLKFENEAKNENLVQLFEEIIYDMENP